MTSIEFNTKLLKLHIHWPDRKRHAKTDQEAIEFYKWLFMNHHDKPEVASLNCEADVVVFLKQNANVLDDKPAPVKVSNSRIEPRISNDVQAVISVDACEENVEIVGMTFGGRTMDLGLHGMKISVETILPEGSKLSLKLHTEEGDTFELTGESRWTRPLGDGQLVGITIFESEGFELWRNQFGLKFVAPRIGRNYKPKGE